MAKTDTTLPAFVNLATANPPKVFTCDVHGQRDFVIRFNGDNTRVRCIDCFEDMLPRTLRSLV